MKKLFLFLSFFLTVFLSFGQISYNAKSIYFAGSAGTSVKDTATFCVSNPCPQGTLIYGAVGSDTTLYIRTRTGWQAIQHGAAATVTASQGLTKVGNDIRLGGTTTGGTLTSITSTAGNGLAMNMGDGTQNGYLQMSPNFDQFWHRTTPISTSLGFKIDGAGGLYGDISGSTLSNRFTYRIPTAIEVTGSVTNPEITLGASTNTTTTRYIKAIGSSANTGLTFLAQNDGSINLSQRGSTSMLVNIGDAANTTLTQGTIAPSGTTANIGLSILAQGNGLMTVGAYNTTHNSALKVGANTGAFLQSDDATAILQSGLGTGVNTGTKLLIGVSTPQISVQDLVATPTGEADLSPSALRFSKLTSAASATNTIASGNGISGSTTGQNMLIQAGNGFGSGATNGGNLTLSAGVSNGGGTMGTMTLGNSNNPALLNGSSVSITSSGNSGFFVSGNWDDGAVNSGTLTIGNFADGFNLTSYASTGLSGDNINFTASSGSINVTDNNASPQGIVYAGSNYVTNNGSLTDKRYVDGKTVSNHTIFTPATGNTISLTNHWYNIVNPTGTLAALTLSLPSSPADNDFVYVKFTKAITTVSYTNGTVNDGITTAAIGTLLVLFYDSGSNTWY